nr:NDM [Neocaridina denticulata sinensis]
MLKAQHCSMTWLFTLLLLCIIAFANAASNASYEERLKCAKKILEEVPLIDGHNDVPYFIRNSVQNQLSKFPFESDLTKLEPFASLKNCHTDLPLLKKGQVGGQFWSAYVPCGSQYKNAATQTLEQIDVIRRLVKKYPKHLQLVTTADGIAKAHSKGKIASMIGVEGGHSIDSSLANLRIFYHVGVRYMTLTHACNTPWAESSEKDKSPKFSGLTQWGELVVKEMNRLGMFVDISHVAVETMHQVLNITRAPVIFSHSSARAIHNHTRNVPDDVLKRMAKNGGVVMVTFVPFFLTPYNVNATMKDLIAHLNHVRDVAGVDHIGLGGDFNGVFNATIGMEDVSKYPHLFAELMADGSWSDEDLKKLAGTNLIRAFKQMEKVRDSLINESPHDTPIPDKDLEEHLACVNPYS